MYVNIFFTWRRRCGKRLSCEANGEIVDSTIVAAPKQRNTNDEKKAIKEGRIPDGWAEKPAKFAQRDRDAP